MKKETGIAKDQYKFLKDQMNAINNKRGDGAEKKDDERIDNADHSYIAFILCIN